MTECEHHCTENLRLEEAREGRSPWKKWGPYLSERQWGTVREDYSKDGNAWDYFTHDHARSRAYRWGEDGLAGISDDHQVLCFAMALWNGQDPILKERLFGLTNSEGNHGEDVKEYYFYLDSTPTHSYMKYLYKYPQAAYPYADLIETNRTRGRQGFEYELLDTGVFDGDRYFDVFVEYAKAAPEDLLIRITVCNRGPEAAPLHVLPTLWFRNTWSWAGGGTKPVLARVDHPQGCGISAHHTDHLFQEFLGADHSLFCEGDVPLLFTENETNHERLFGAPNASAHVKDGINDYVVHGRHDAVNPSAGSKAAALYALTVGAGETRTIRLRLAPTGSEACSHPFHQFDEIFATRLQEADAFYDGITPPAVKANPDRARVLRQALAGMLWSKQYYYFDVHTWLQEHDLPLGAHAAQRSRMRNGEWFHMYNADVISMPDKWEYPWYAAWDLAFHALALASVDIDFAKNQLDLMLRNDYIHPNGQMPAYEWNFGDVNPPVHAYAVMQVYLRDKESKGQGDLAFLTHAFEKLLLNFTWWLNRKDRSGNNAFEGGFLGLDNIGVFDRSSPLPTGGFLEQADGTAWMVFFSQQMLRMAGELALHDAQYEEFVSKFAAHTAWISSALAHSAGTQGDLWDEEDGFFYDVLRLPDGNATRLKVRSMVGLLPLAAVAVFEDSIGHRMPAFQKYWKTFLERRPNLTANLHMPTETGVAGRRMISIVDQTRLRRILEKMLDESEFLGPHGIRALSRFHHEHPFVFHAGGQEFRVAYVPGDSDSGMFGGNSNWRGPVWMPVNLLMYNSLLRLGSYFGDSFQVECPTGSGRRMNLIQVAHELAERLIGTFERNDAGRRPCYGGTEKFQDDPHWRDLILFNEYFHGDNGAGIGASHQTGWTGCIAQIILANGVITEEMARQGDFQQQLFQHVAGQATHQQQQGVTK